MTWESPGVSDLCHASFRKSTPKYARFYASGVLLDPRGVM
jgi:hypothetical protein